MKKVISLLVAVALLASMSVFATTNASASTTWSLPLDVTDKDWHAETWDPAYAWAAPLAEVSDTIIGESTTDSLELKFPEGGKADMTYPNARYENAGGIVNVLEDDYINIKVSCGEAGQTNVRFAILLNFLANQINLTEAMVEAGATSHNNEGLQVVGGDYEMSIKVSDAAKKYYETHADAKGTYDAIWGPGGNNFLTGVVFYLYSNERNSEIPLEIKAVTIGDEGDFGAPGAAGSTGATSSAAASTASVAAESTAASSEAASTVSSKADTSSAAVSSAKASSTPKAADDGLGAGAIAGIIIGAVVVLAAIAVVVVLVVKKGKKGDAAADATADAETKDESAEEKEDK